MFTTAEMPLEGAATMSRDPAAADTSAHRHGLHPLRRAIERRSRRRASAPLVRDRSASDNAMLQIPAAIAFRLIA